MQTIWTKKALTANGWQSNVRVEIKDGIIHSVTPDAKPSGETVGILLPAPANVHSHAFQRAMAGMTEQRGDDPSDNFWTWRKLMYRFMTHLTPDDVETITAFVQMEMLEAGFGASAEFHYLHHQSDGTPYDNKAEMSERIITAAQTSGIGLTLLPVLYEQGGCDGRALGAGQVRFGHDFDAFAELVESAGKALSALPSDAQIGVAPHSLRAVSKDSLARIASLLPGGPVHIHLAEQVGEVEEVLQAYGQRPTEWLYDHHEVDERWSLIHATQLQPHETLMIANSGAVAGLCPITEANLGDGIFDGIRYFEAGGQFGIGSDSNIRISLSEELRALEYSQRLKHLGRAVLATETQSSGRVLLEGAAKGGARAVGRNSGSIEIGKTADLFALDSNNLDLIGKDENMILDGFIFTGNKSMITDVWSAGRHLVKQGAHKNRDAISARYRESLTALMGRVSA